VQPTTFYAIGDVHGLADRLGRLHEAILGDLAERGGPAAIVHLGDYVDRGPDSRQAIDRIMALQQSAPQRCGAFVHALLGNHERLMLEAYDRNSPGAETTWRLNRGEETIESYGATRGDPAWREAIDPAHIAWLRALPSMLVEPAHGLAFVHAGIEPAAFPDCAEEIRLWTRSERFFNTESWPDTGAAGDPWAHADV
jgi:serine/threonine protein phosphatase 1